MYDICNQEFKQETRLKGHISKVHDPEGICDHCNQRYNKAFEHRNCRKIARKSSISGGSSVASSRSAKYSQVSQRSLENLPTRPANVSTSDWINTQPSVQPMQINQEESIPMILRELSNHQRSLNILETKKNDTVVIQTDLIRMNEKVEKQSKEIFEKVRDEFEQRFEERAQKEVAAHIVKMETAVSINVSINALLLSILILFSIFYFIKFKLKY